jgi:C4-dicarboxylate-binding protein DctP
MKRTIFSLAAMALAMTGPAAAQDPMVIKFSHVVAIDAPKHKAAEKFKELAEKYTGGKVKVEVYPNSQLFKDKEELEALQLGSVHLLAPSTSKFGPLGVKEFEALDLPYLFKDEANFKKFAVSDLGKSMLDKLSAKGVKGLAYWDNGFQILGTNKPAKMPDDFKGMKLRIQGSKVLDAQVRAMGALPQVMAFSELYQALQTGVVDGAENVPSNIWTQKLFEVMKHINESHHGHLSYAVVANQKWWDGLTPEMRGHLEKAMNEASEHFDSIAKKENTDAIDNIRKTGKSQMHVQTAEEKKAWIKVLMPVHQEMEKRVGKETIEALYKVTGFSVTQ